jgi:glycosyltransferase involved in cell wall biosynthesis/GT2 family glycosyltransferase
MPFDENGNWEKPKRPSINSLELKEEAKPTFELAFPDDWRGVTGFDYTPFAKQTSKSVDIVVPIYRAATQLKACIESIFKHTNREFQLYLVDDYSNDSAIEELLKSVEDVPNVTVLRQDVNRGFAATVNVGCRAGDGYWTVILNSDTLVTPNWLTKCIAAGEADERNAIVNPVTNNTALINVPMLPGCSYYDMNRLMEQTSSQDYPEIMPTGFCFIIRKDVLHRLGYLDEGFHSYGEETDLWMRVLMSLDHGVQKGLRAVLADDTYIFHERGTSFSALGQASHMSLRQKGNERFHERNPSYQQWANTIDTSWIGRIRNQVPPDQKGSPNLVWLVTDASQCGGMDLIADYVNALIEEGWNAKVAVVRRDPEDDSPVTCVPHLRTQPFILRTEDDVFKFPIHEGTVVAATTELLAAAHKIKAANPGLKILHHIQSNDLLLAPEENKKDILTLLKSDDTDYHMAASQWAGDALLEAGGRKGPIPVVLPGVDTLLFHPRERSGDPRPTVLFHINKNYPFKGYDRAVQVAHYLVQKDIRVLAVGDVSVPEVPQVVAVGKVSKTRMAQLLSEVDLVVDPSYNHSYGMPQAEALASGVPFVCWDNMGCWEFGKDSAAMIINNESATEYASLADFIADRTVEFSNPVQRHSLLQPKHGSHSRSDNVEHFLRELSVVLEAGVTRPKKIVLVTPHVRKHGGPTTIIDLANGLKERGHTVLVTSVYSDYSPEVMRVADVPINFDWSNPVETDLLICHGDSDKFEFFEKYPAKKKVMLKLSHNPRFMALEKQGLGIEWDHVMTSTEWLRDLCVGDTNGVKQWANDEVTRVGWRHYTHDIFDRFNDRSYGSFNSELTIGSLHHNHPTKGSAEALNVMKAIQIDYSNVNFALVGEVPGIKARKPFNYIYRPDRKEMARVMSQCDIWVVASHSEGLGRMALEAASAGAALVCTDTGSEYLVDEENCLLVPVKDPDALLAAVERLMKDDGLRAKLRYNAYQTTTEKSDSKPYLDAVEGVIRKVFNE